MTKKTIQESKRKKTMLVFWSGLKKIIIQVKKKKSRIGGLSLSVENIKKIGRKKIWWLSFGSFGIILIGLGIFLVRPYMASIAMQKGNQNFNQNVYDLVKAEKWYKVASLLAPKSSQAHYQLGRVYFVENKMDRAISEFDITLRANSEQKRAYYMRGLARGYKEDYVGSQADFQSFVDSFPNEWAGYNDLAWAYYQNKQYDKARDVAEKGVELFPENAWLLNGLGVAYIGLGEKDRAQEILEKASAKAENLTVSEWKLAYPGNDPASADINLAIFKSDIQENIFSAKSVLAMNVPKFASACNSSTMKVCSGASCVDTGYVCDSDPIYHCPAWGGSNLCTHDPWPDGQLCSLTGVPGQCNSNADCVAPCVPNCSNAPNVCLGTAFGNGCGGPCWGTKDCNLPVCWAWSNPANIVTSGSSTLSWRSSANTTQLWFQCWGERPGGPAARSDLNNDWTASYTIPGVETCYFTPVNGSGVVGSPCWASIVVHAPTAPSCTASFDPPSITAGNSSTLSWRSSPNTTELWSDCTGLLPGADRNFLNYDWLVTYNTAGSENCTFYVYNAVRDMSSCSASLTVIDPSAPITCGSADGQTLASAPSGASLCSDRTTTPAVTGTGPWNWTCGVTPCTASKTAATCTPDPGCFAAACDASCVDKPYQCIDYKGCPDTPVCTPACSGSRSCACSSNSGGWKEVAP